MGELSNKFRILAEISEKLPEKKRPILVEFYTRGTCKSIDIDLPAVRNSPIPVLEKMGEKHEVKRLYSCLSGSG